MNGQIRMRRKIGQETFRFVDGSEEVIDIHAVPSCDIMRIKRQFKSYKNIQSKEPIVEIQEEQIILHTLKLAIGDKLSIDDLMQCETDLGEVYAKYFTQKVLTDEKKDKSAE